MLSIFALLLLVTAYSAEEMSLVADMQHLRNSASPEWDEFVDQSGKRRPVRELRHPFTSRSNTEEWTLELQQFDVRQQWQIELNGKRLGQLDRDENKLTMYLSVPPRLLRDGMNEISVRCKAKAAADDIFVGSMTLHPKSRDQFLSQAQLEVHVTDEHGKPLPSRLTIVNSQGALQGLGLTSTTKIAVRAGTVYTSAGRATLKLPTGRFKIFAGRGFEYSRAETEVNLKAGDNATVRLQLQREVDTTGWIACDTHVHSLTHSGHGDATVEERMLTLAGEGIELPIATDHNVQVDHGPFAAKMQVRQYFTPVIGNEVTTKSGHFNVFPFSKEAKTPDFKSPAWEVTLKSIFERASQPVVILNHARDLHSGVRPFAPNRFNAASGSLLLGRAGLLRPLDNANRRPSVNAMEIINSSATQSQPLQLTFDWLALLNRGQDLTPVGSSDSHDVLRHFVGQGRTYIRGDDRNPDKLDVRRAVDQFLSGKVTVSYGLFADLRINESYPGATITPDGNELRVTARILGPHWVQADRVRLFMNGRAILDETIQNRDGQRGVLWQRDWRISSPPHDAHFVLIAEGPGIESPCWKSAKPYQPTSTKWTPRSLAVSGAIWVDGDRDGSRRAPRHYAEQIHRKHTNLKTALAKLADFDEATSIQFAEIHEEAPNTSLFDEHAQQALRLAPPKIQQAFRRYLAAKKQEVR